MMTDRTPQRAALELVDMIVIEYGDRLVFIGNA